MVLGGKKLFADGSAPRSLKLTASRVAPNGLIVAHYERKGEIKRGGAPVGLALGSGDHPAPTFDEERKKRPDDSFFWHVPSRAGGLKYPPSRATGDCHGALGLERPTRSEPLRPPAAPARAHPNEAKCAIVRAGGVSPRGALPKIDIASKQIGKERRSPAEKRLEPPFAQTPTGATRSVGRAGIRHDPNTAPRVPRSVHQPDVSQKTVDLGHSYAWFGGASTPLAHLSASRRVLRLDGRAPA